MQISQLLQSVYFVQSKKHDADNNFFGLHFGVVSAILCDGVCVVGSHSEEQGEIIIFS